MSWSSTPGWNNRGWAHSGVTWAAVAAADTLSNGALTVTHNTDVTQTMPRSTGAGIAAASKKFFEITISFPVPADGGNIAFGFTDATIANTGHYVGETAHSGGITVSGTYLDNGGATGSGHAPYGLTGDTYLVAINGLNFYVYNSRNGFWNNSVGDPVNDTGGHAMSALTFPVFPAISLYNINDAATLNCSANIASYVNAGVIAGLTGFTPYTG